jgi:DNA-binding response OmpR family regulator
MSRNRIAWASRLRTAYETHRWRARVKLLVVDDAEEAIGTDDGETSLDLVEQERPDLLLLDNAMPGIDGFGTLRGIQAYSDVPVPLTATEYKLLYHLVRTAGRVLRHETLLAKVWGREYLDEVDDLRVYVRRLRLKLVEDPDKPRRIVTERGLRYRFQVDDP